MNLLVEYFTPKDPNRDNEFIFCLHQNLMNPLIENVFIFISDESVLKLQNPKIQIIKSSVRPTYFDLFQFTNDNLQGQICIIANTDIFFDDSLINLKNHNFDNGFMALTRWDIYTDGSQWYIRYYNHMWREIKDPFGNVTDDSIFTGELSQDAWIYKSPVKLDERCKFTMGKPGCDNRIAQLFHELGYNVTNPSKLIIIKHYHQTNIRNYTEQDTIPGPYLLIRPTDDLKIVPKKQTIQNF